MTVPSRNLTANEKKKQLTLKSFKRKMKKKENS